MRLRLDDNDAFGADSLIALLQKPGLDVVGECGRVDIEAQVNGVRYLVDVLPTRALRTNGAQADFRFLNGEQNG